MSEQTQTNETFTAILSRYLALERQKEHIVTVEQCQASKARFEALLAQYLELMGGDARDNMTCALRTSISEHRLELEAGKYTRVA